VRRVSRVRVAGGVVASHSRFLHRRELVECADYAPLKGKVDIIKGTAEAWQRPWLRPMEFCQYKVVIHAQGEGFTSSKNRLLPCGSVIVTLNNTNMDMYV